MKNILLPLLAIFTALVCGCSVTHEMKEGATFAKLKTFYVDTPVGTSLLFADCGSVSDADTSLKNAITEFLKARGYEPVADKAKAQIVFRPLWNVSAPVMQTEEGMPISYLNAQTTTGIGMMSQDLYARLEIQAILPESGDMWSWRGFSPLKMSPKNFNEGMIKDQVSWCLEYFPPDNYPSKLEETKKEKKEAVAVKEENPYKEVLVKEREKQEKSAQ